MKLSSQTKLAAVSALALNAAATGAVAEIGAVPTRHGGFYVTVDGGYQWQRGAETSAFGDVSGPSAAAAAANTNGTAGASMFASPELVASRGVTAVPGSNQDVTAFSVGGPVSIDAALSSSDGTNTADATAKGSAGLNGFSSALATAAVNGAAASANAEGGRLIGAEKGRSGGVSVGFAMPSRDHFFDRIELYGTFSRSKGEASVNGAAAGISVDGTTAFAAAAVLPAQGPAFGGIGPVSIAARQDLAFDEFGVRFKGRELKAAPIPLFLSVEGFYGRFRQQTAMRADTGGLIDPIDAPRILHRNADVDGGLLGAQLALETSIPLHSMPVSFLGRASAGTYFLKSDGKFTDNFGLADIQDSSSSVGLRFGAETGVRFALGHAATLSLTGAVDHFTDVPTAELPRFAGGGTAKIGSDSLTAYRANGRLTFFLGTP